MIPAGVANGSPAFGQYKPDDAGGYQPWALQVLELREGRIGGVAPRFQTIHFEYSQRKTLAVDAPEILKQMREDRVDVAVLTAI